jgi:hypothetical protein
MRCSACGAENPDPARVCGRCGLGLAPGAVLANDATAFGARADALVAVADRDDAIEALFTERAQILDRKTNRTFGREERIAGLRALLAVAREPVSRHEPLATLGRSLALLRRTLSASGIEGRTSNDGGAYRIEELCVIEADERGRCARAELFAVDHLGAAITRLYERHAETRPEGPERQRTAAIARAVAAVLGPPDPDPVGPVLALDVQYADHRLLGWGAVRGVVAFLRALRTLRRALPSVEERTIELLVLRADALLVRRAITGALDDGMSHYRRRPLALWRFDADGRVSHWEQFDGDQREQALARLDELATPTARSRIVETTATRAVDRFHPGDPARHVLATRGDRLVLTSDAKSLLLIEVDRRGNQIETIRVDFGDREAAYHELDARYAKGEAAEHPAMWKALADARRALLTRDWEDLSRLVSPDLVAEDHRPLGWGIARSPQAYATAIRPVSELRPDVALRFDHLLLADRAALLVVSWIGSDAGRPFAIPLVVVFGLGRDGRIRRAHHYNLEELAEARARFADLA